MDHKLAETRQAVEKYTLNELSLDERAEFEVHMFDCPICSDLVRQNFTVTENLKQAIAEQKFAVERKTAPHTSWLDMFRWPSLVPSGVAIALLAFIAYQNVPAAPDAAHVLPFTEALMTASRGSIPVINIDPHAPITLLKVNVDKLPMGPFEGQLDQGGKRVLSVEQSVKTSDDPVEIAFPAKSLKSGQYELRLLSHADASITPVTYTFQVQNLTR